MGAGFGGESTFNDVEDGVAQDRVAQSPARSEVSHHGSAEAVAYKYQTRHFGPGHFLLGQSDDVEQIAAQSFEAEIQEPVTWDRGIRRLNGRLPVAPHIDR